MGGKTDMLSNDNVGGETDILSNDKVGTETEMLSNDWATALKWSCYPMTQ